MSNFLRKQYSQAGFGKAGIMIVSAAAFFLVVGGLYFFTNQKATAPSEPDENAVVSFQNEASEQGTEAVQETATPLSAAEIDTSTWKTYRNEEYGFEVKYPPHWDSQDVEGTILLSSKEVEAGSDNTESRLVFCPKGGCRDFGFDLDTTPESAPIMIGKFSADKATYFRGDSIKKEINIIFINFEPALGSYPDFQINFKPFGNTSTEDLVALDKILSTFKFTR